jgi:HAT1-interacting factor 1
VPKLRHVTDCFICRAEKFDEAIADYQKGVELKTTLLPTSSRQLAEVHYKLSLVLDMTSGRLNDAIRHVEKALESTQARLDELRAALAGNAPTTEEKTTETTNDVKGKGKAVVLRLGNDNVTNLSKTQIEAEIKDIEELSADLKLKVC